MKLTKTVHIFKKYIKIQCTEGYKAPEMNDNLPCNVIFVVAEDVTDVYFSGKLPFGFYVHDDLILQF